MVNLEHKLTVDDLIVEYMMYKVRNGYEPSFLTCEFMSFLYFFESKMEVIDSLYENVKLFQRFFERKGESDWSRTKDWHIKEKEIHPHMDMLYSEKDGDYLIRANYKLSEFDRSVINTYFMDNGMGKYEDFRGQTFKIRRIIQEYLKDEPKRIINKNITPSKNETLIGKYVTARIITSVWESDIKQKIENNEWPRQCNDINKYLLEMDLANIIKLKSIKKDLLELYSTISRRIAALYHDDKNLMFSSFTSSYLAKANYELIVNGYEAIMNSTFGEYKKSLNVDLSSLAFKETNVIDGVYYCDDDFETKPTTSEVGNNKIKTLVKKLDICLKDTNN